ncbi:MAG: hybrid sensor histidine kinase/response regulator, partial [Bacteroidota bacterium]
MTVSPIQQKRSEEPGCVLVVDDDERIRRFETGLLEAQGYTVITAQDGTAALRGMEDRVPDVVLLDVNMPGMNGIEVCRKIKTNPSTQHVPVILVTGCNERSDRLAGMEAGARDFLAKPADPDDLCLRVRNAIHMKRLFDQVSDGMERLKELEHMRDSMVQMLVHDMRTPLSSVSMCLDFLSATTDKQYRDDRLAAQEHARGSVRTLQEMANSMLDVSRLDKNTMPLKVRSCLMSELVRDALHAVKPTMGRAMVVVDEPGTPVAAACDPDVIRRVFINLISNAVHAMAYQGTVDVSIRDGDAD